MSDNTALHLISRALRLAGVLQQGENAGPDNGIDVNDCLETLVDLLEELEIERCMCYQIVNQTFSLVSGQLKYSIGPSGADFTAPRPVRIERAHIDVVQSTPTVTLPLEISSFDTYSDITVKSTMSPIPRKIYYEPAVPNGNLYLWPEPSFSNHLVLWYWVPLTIITSLTSNVTLPPAYKRLLRYNLAVEFAAEFGMPLPPAVAEIAESTRVNIKRLNTVLPISVSDPALVQSKKTFNYLIGE